MKRLGKESGFDISTPQHKCARLFGQRALMPLPVPASLLCIAANAQWYVLLLWFIRVAERFTSASCAGRILLSEDQKRPSPEGYFFDILPTYL